MHSNSHSETRRLLLSFFPKTSLPRNKPMLPALKELIGHPNPKHARTAMNLMQVCMGFHEKQFEHGRLVSNSDQIFHHCHQRLRILRQEALMLVLLDRYGQFRSDALITVGNHAHLSASISDILAPVLERRCPGFIMVHNRPDRICRPTKADIEFTGVVRRAVEFFGIELLDHLLIAGGEYYSFRIR